MFGRPARQASPNSLPAKRGKSGPPVLIFNQLLVNQRTRFQWIQLAILGLSTKWFEQPMHRYRPWNLRMSKSSEAGQWREATWWLQSMVRKQLAPNDVACNMARAGITHTASLICQLALWFVVVHYVTWPKLGPFTCQGPRMQSFKTRSPTPLGRWVAWLLFDGRCPLGKRASSHKPAMT